MRTRGHRSNVATVARGGVLAAASCACCLLSSACAALTPKDSKVEAQQRWGQVRARVKNQLAAQQYAAGFFEECIKTASEAATLDPTSTEAYVLLARSNLELGRPASAQQALDAAGQHGLRSADLSYTEGVIMEQSERLGDAVERYRDALARNPAHADALLAATELLVELDRPAEARALLGEHAERVDDKAAVLLLAARLARLSREEDAAVNRYMDAIGFSGRSPQLAEEAGLYFATIARCHLAVAVLEPLFQKNIESTDDATGTAGEPDTDTFSPSDSALKALAGCRLELGDAEGARQLLIPWVAQNPTDPAAQLLLAKAALAKGDLGLAQFSIGQARARLPGNPEIRFVGALVDWKLGSIEAARSTMAKLADERPGDADARCVLGELLIESGDATAAAERFQEALELAPASTWAASGLSRAQDAASGSR